MNKLMIFYADDWAVLYVNGEDKHQGHEIRLEDLTHHLPIESLETRWVDGTPLEACLEDGGRFPYKLEEALALLKS